MKELSGEEIVLLATTTAIRLSKEYDPDEITLLSDFLTLLGTALLTIADRKNLDSGASSGTKQNKSTAQNGGAKNETDNNNNTKTAQNNIADKDGNKTAKEPDNTKN